MSVVKFLDLVAQYHSIKTEVDEAISRTIASASFIGGASLASFEKEFAEFQHAEYCVGVGNGTDALEIALESLSLPAGGEVIVPANSFIASSEAVTRAGLKVVFADVDADDYTLDLVDVERRINERTVAIVAVHLYGHPCRMDQLIAIARRHQLRIVEDCAQAHGAEYAGRRVGSLGDISAFSFYPGKNLGAYGDGGAIVTNNAILAQRCRMIANHGRVAKYDHEFEGRNSRLDGLQAAILSVKLRHLDAWVEQRNVIADVYFSCLGDCGQIVLPQRVGQIRHAFHLFVIRTPLRDSLAEFLRQRGIETGVHYPISLPRLKAYASSSQSAESMLANRLCDELLSLPMGDHLTVEQALQVVQAIKEFFASR